MLLHQLMDKVARGINLNSTERQELILLMRSMEDVINLSKSWVTPGTSTPAFINPVIVNPNFRSSPLHVFHAYMTTDVATTSGNYASLLFDTSAGDTSVFDFWNNDKSKIRIDRSQLNITIDGIVRWEPNATGDRVLRQRVFNAAAAEIASQEISVVPAATSGGFQTDVNFSYTENIHELFPAAAYMILEAMQSSGGPLNVQSAVLSVRIA